MPQTDDLWSLLAKAERTTERIVQHLLRSPWDLGRHPVSHAPFPGVGGGFPASLGAATGKGAEQPSS